MFVQRVVMPDSRRESWTVLDGDAVPIGPVERYLAYLTDIERSPNTIKAYAHDLKDWFVFLAARGLDWREVRLEDVGEFVAWLRLPLPARDRRVAVLASVTSHCGPATVNRKLSAVSAFYQHAARHGVELGELLRTWHPSGARSNGWRPFLHHVSKGDPVRCSAIKLSAPHKRPRILSVLEAQAVLDGCDRLRDRLLFAVLFETGMRIGEALGLRHEDWAATEGTVEVVPRVNDNGARAKSGEPRTIPVAAPPRTGPRWSGYGPSWSSCAPTTTTNSPRSAGRPPRNGPRCAGRPASSSPRSWPGSTPHPAPTPPALRRRGAAAGSRSPSRPATEGVPGATVGRLSIRFSPGTRGNLGLGYGGGVPAGSAASRPRRG